jgi:sugar lactone lactonase YvrE
MRTMIAALLLQVLTAPDPAQMEQVRDLGYTPVPHGFNLPDGLTWGAPSGVAVSAEGHVLIFNRGAYPLLEFDAGGTFVRAFGEGRYARPHGLRIDAENNIWTTDVVGHTVTKMSWEGRVLLVLGVNGQSGDGDNAAHAGLLNQPNDVSIGPAGDIFVAQGHGMGDPRVLRFDKTGKFIKSWGGKGTGPGQFDIAHSIAIDAAGLVYVADRQNRRIQVFNVEGGLVKEWKYAGLPCGLYINRDGRMYLTSGFAGQILELDGNGRALAATGRPGKNLGEFGEAHFMALGHKGEIYVADTVNATLQKFVRK